MNIDPAFGNWLAGFADGEGCFRIHRHPRGYFACFFEIKLRSDDRAILEDIREQLGVGSLYYQKRLANSHGVKSHPTVMFRADNKSECSVIRDVFCSFPLRAKKAEDCSIWCKAVDCWVAHRRGDSWNDMAALKDRLELGREFKE